MLGIYVNEMQRSVSGLGDQPNDFEAAYDLCYLPVREAWYYGTPVRPADAGLPNYLPLPGGLGNPSLLAAEQAVNGNEAALAAIRDLAKVQKRLLAFQTLSAVAVSALTVFSVVQALRGKTVKI